MSYSLPNPAFL